MPFHRFETYADQMLTVHLSSAKGPIIEGESIYFCLVTKEPGTGSEIHYHPNEQFQVPLSGKLNALVGTDRRIMRPGTMTHIPLFGQHQIKATEDGPATYLYIKSMNWTTVGLAADEGVPDKASTIAEANEKYASGVWPGQVEKGASQARVAGLGLCFYTLWDDLSVPYKSATCTQRIEGRFLIGEMADLAPGFRREWSGQEELFAYVIDGALYAESGSDAKHMGKGDILQVCGQQHGVMRVEEGDHARVFIVQATAALRQAMRKDS